LDFLAGFIKVFVVLIEAFAVGELLAHDKLARKFLFLEFGVR